MSLIAWCFNDGHAIISFQAFYCEWCGKQYASVTEWETHLMSYGHNHTKNIKELRQAEAQRRAAMSGYTKEEKRDKEARREERALAKRMKAAQGKPSAYHAVPRAAADHGEGSAGTPPGSVPPERGVLGGDIDFSSTPLVGGAQGFEVEESGGGGGGWVADDGRAANSGFVAVESESADVGVSSMQPSQSAACPGFFVGVQAPPPATGSSATKGPAIRFGFGFKKR